MRLKIKLTGLRSVPRHFAFLMFIFIATFPMLHMWLVQYFFFWVYYLLLYIQSERNGGKMTPLLRLMEAGLSVYLFALNTMTFLTGIYFAPAFFGAAALFVCVWLFLMALKKLPVPRFFFLSAFFPFLCFAFIPDPVIQKQLIKDCSRVVYQQEVKPVLSFCDKDWIKKFSPFLSKRNLRHLLNNSDSPRAVLTTDDPDFVYISFGRPNYRKPKEPYFAVAKINRRTGKIAGAVASSSLLHLAYDRKHKRIFGTALDENMVYVLREKPFKLEDKFPTALHPIDVFADESTDTIYVLSDYDVALYDLETFEKKRAFTPSLAPNMFVVSPKFKKAYVCGYATTFILRAVDTVTGSIVRTRAGWVPPFSMLCSGTVLDEKQGIAFVSVPLERRLYAHDALTLQRLYRFHVPRGIRDIDYDPEKELLFAGNYITGNLEIIDPFTQMRVKHIFVGKRIRDIFFSPVTKKVYVATSLGFFEVTP